MAVENDNSGGGSDPSLRDALESAFNADEKGEASQARTEADVPVSRVSGAESAEAKGAQPRQMGVDRGDGRDATGRFAGKPAGEAADAAGRAPAREDPAHRETPAGTPRVAGKAAQTKEPFADAPVTSQQQTQRDLYARAPQSWRPGAREQWSSLTPEVREEVHRRERESARIAQESSQARNVATYVQRLQQQFAPALQAEGVDALTASANLMQLASRMRFGTPVEKAQLVATVVRQYGVDVVALAAALDGMEAAQGRAPQMQQPYQDPRVDQLLGQLQSAQQERAEAIRSQATSEVEGWGANKEFFEDVRADMGDLMELAAKRGIDMTMEQAYERACLMNPDIAKVLTARKAASSAGNGSPSIQRAKTAASSVRGAPSSTPTSTPTTLRGDIEAAIEAVGG